jgi:hypothetical protein
MNLIVSSNQRGWLGRAALLALALFAPAALATNLVAHWKQDESNAPYADFGSNGVALNHDAATTTPFLVPGYNDGAAQLRWQNPPGVATINGLMNLFMLPMWITSGIFFSVDRFPEAVQPYLRVLPLTPLIDAIRSVMLEGATLSSLGWELGSMLIWSVVSFAVALKFFRWG